MHIVRHNAFTLIELLLVIAIVSIMAALGVMIYRQSFQTNRVDTVSLEMQHVLEAAMAFYVDTGAWPTAQPCGSSLMSNTFVTSYLPNGNATSPFGNDYCWAQAGGSSNRLFWVAVQVPGVAADSLATATRIAGRLPNAVTTSAPDQPDMPPSPCNGDSCFARAEITVPGASTNAVSGLTIAATGNCQTRQTIANTGSGTCADTSAGGASQAYQISFKACSSNTQPILIANPNFVTFPQVDGGHTPASSLAQSTGCMNNSNNPQQQICNLSVSVSVCAGSLSGACSVRDVKTYSNTTEGASYIVVCEPIVQNNAGRVG